MAHDLSIPKWFDEDLDDDAGAPPASANPVIPTRYGQDILHADDAWVPPAYQRFPYFRFATAQPILYRYGRDVLKADEAFNPLGYQRFPFFQEAPVTTSPVVPVRRAEFPYSDDRLVHPQFGKFPFFKQPPQPVFYRVAGYPVDPPDALPRTGFYTFPWVSTTPPPPANPVIPYMRGQWIGDTVPDWHAVVQYRPFPFFSSGVVGQGAYRPMITQHDMLHLTDVRG